MWEQGRSTVAPGYALGLGANIDPERNLGAALVDLAARFGKLLVSRAYKTAPVGMTSANVFINLAVRISTDLDPVACKAVLVGIETRLGRDREHPDCKVRDRSCDIDIHGRCDGRGGGSVGWERPSYLAAPIDEIACLVAGLPIPPAAPGLHAFLVEGLRLGDAPCAVRWDAAAGRLLAG